MTEKNIDKVRQAAKEALLQGASGREIALLFKASNIALEQAETEMQVLGFFAQDDGIDQSQSSTHDPAKSGAVRRGKF